MSVYFIQNEKGRIKIGFSNDPEKRLKELQTATDEELKIIGIKPGGLSEEKRIQKIFEFAHVRREWFDPVSELLNFVKVETGNTVHLKKLVCLLKKKNWIAECVRHNTCHYVTQNRRDGTILIEKYGKTENFWRWSVDYYPVIRDRHEIFPEPLNGRGGELTVHKTEMSDKFISWLAEWFFAYENRVPYPACPVSLSYNETWNCEYEWTKLARSEFERQI